MTEEYHNELYGYIESQGWIEEYKQEKETIPYKRLRKNGTVIDEDLILTQYIRHQIHHPENKQNIRFTTEELKKSIRMMRVFIALKNEIS